MFWNFWLVFIFFIVGAAAISGLVLGAIAFTRTENNNTVEPEVLVSPKMEEY